MKNVKTDYFFTELCVLGLHCVDQRCWMRSKLSSNTKINRKLKDEISIISETNILTLLNAIFFHVSVLMNEKGGQ